MVVFSSVSHDVASNLSHMIRNYCTLNASLTLKAFLDNFLAQCFVHFCAIGDTTFSYTPYSVGTTSVTQSVLAFNHFLFSLSLSLEKFSISLFLKSFIVVLKVYMYNVLYNQFSINNNELMKMIRFFSPVSRIATCNLQPVPALRPHADFNLFSIFNDIWNQFHKLTNIFFPFTLTITLVLGPCSSWMNPFSLRVFN